MLNFRKLKQDYSPPLLKQGKELYDEGIVVSAKIIKLTPQAVRVTASVVGNYQNTYTSEIEINLSDSTTNDADCDCLHKYDCQHLAAVLFYLEEHYHEMVVAYSKETDIEQEPAIDQEARETLLETIKEAETREVARQDRKNQKELIQEYTEASVTLGRSPFFLPEEILSFDQAELALIFNENGNAPNSEKSDFEVQLALRLPFRSKPLYVHNIREFLHAIRDAEAIYLTNKRFFFSFDSFDAQSCLILQILLNSARFPDSKNEKGAEKALRVGLVDAEAFGMLLARVYDADLEQKEKRNNRKAASPEMPRLYRGSLEEPLLFANSRAQFQFNLEYLEAPAPKVLINPTVLLDYETPVLLEALRMFTCAKPGFIFEETYYRFPEDIKKKHLMQLDRLRRITIPEPLFGTFIENSIPQLMHYGKVSNREVIERFVTLPFTEDLRAECEILFLNGELEATLHFLYGSIKVPAAPSKLNNGTIFPFIKDEGILARNLTEEQKILEDLFQDFQYDAAQGNYIAKTDKKIIEFMTEVVPRYQDRVTFNCPQNLLEQFIYDNTEFKIHLSETDRIDQYQVTLTVTGHLSGVSVDQLWECLSSKRTYIELMPKKSGRKRRGEIVAEAAHLQKILVLDLEKLRPLVQIFDEIGIRVIDSHSENRPLWSLASINEAHFQALPVKFSMSKQLQQIQKQMLGEHSLKPAPIPKNVNATLREYQVEGVNWLERLRTMHLNGILADDMGLGKTLQAITAITQFKQCIPDSLSLIVCPTSLVYNWKEEFHKFNSKLRALPVDGTPTQRKKLLEESSNFDVIITSYSLLQKDIEHYKLLKFGYVILDEAQHIKNRGTRNAKSVKMIGASHRLILTGTPIENSLDELWSLFDFLMPGLLSSYDRFVEKYIRNPNRSSGDNMENLKNKVSPFILRRMKRDVVSELPPISEIVYHCHLSETQKELYRSYAQSAREELAQLVKRDGFDRVQIHVLATLTRLKQICCHPAIFAKDSPERGDSAKYEMLMELMQTLIEGRHKTVIFSQYTRMLTIMKEDFLKMGIRFEYLDGASKNRLDIVKRFNEDQTISVFLVSLKAGGVGLNLVGADTVIHYDMWWNPAVESQATDRVHRIGQTQSVSSYKLVTLNTIEEKIMELQNRKKGLVKKIVSFEDEVIAKLTWEEVLELLQA